MNSVPTPMTETVAARQRPWMMCALATLTSIAATSASPAADLPPPPPQAVRALAAPDVGIRRFGLIVIGLPGDEEHARLYGKTVREWRASLKSLAGVPDERLFVLTGSQAADSIAGATSGDVQDAVQNVAEQIRTEDALWVLLLGHGSYDGQHTWFHLPGPDLHEGDWADLFARLNCREQVFWLTQSASGGFVRALSRPDRIVIAATQATGEVNETRFPHVLNDVLGRDALEMDADGDGRLSVLELFHATDSGVASYFEENELAATEHAQLDDNADGAGSEAGSLIEPGVEQLDPAAPQIDGALAARTIVITLSSTGEFTGEDE